MNSKSERQITGNHKVKGGKLALLKVLIAGTACLGAVSAFAQDVTITRDPASGAVIAIKPNQMLSRRARIASARVNNEASAQEAILAYGGEFGVADPAKELVRGQSKTDDLGTTHVAFGQYNEGVPVWGSQVSVHLDAGGNVESLTGKTAGVNSIDIIPALSQNDAEIAALEHWKLKSAQQGTVKGATALYVLNPSESNQLSEAKLVWVVTVTQGFPHKDAARLFVDAHSGIIVHAMTLMPDIQRKVWDCYPGQPCYLDARGQTTGYYYGRSEGQPARGTHPFTHNTDTDQAYDLVASLHNYYQTIFGINGANRKGGLGDDISAPSAQTNLYVNIDNVSDICPNAYYDTFSLNFCTGYVITDVTAHEYQHAVTEYSVFNAQGQHVSLDYEGEAGALNESFSDIFAAFYEGRVEGFYDWTVGEDLPSGGALRDMRNPPSKGDPDKMFSANFTCGTEDNGGVHTNSNVMNKALYLMVQGDSFNGCNISPIGGDKAEKIFFRAVTTYLPQNATFVQAYQALTQSCTDLGYGDAICSQVRNALQAVEMDQGSPCNGATEHTPACASGSQNPNPQPNPQPNPNPNPAPNPAPGPNSPGPSSPGTPGGLSLNGRVIQLRKKVGIARLSGKVFTAQGAFVPNVGVNLACSARGAAFSTSVATDARGSYELRLSISRGLKVSCRAGTGGLVSGSIKLNVPR